MKPFKGNAPVEIFLSLDKRKPLTLPRNLASLQLATFLSVIHSGKKNKKKITAPNIHSDIN